MLTAQVIVTELRLARYEQAQEGTVPEEMEMEPLSLPGWAAPTLAGLLRGPAGSAPRLTCTIATRKEMGTETLRLLQACTLEIRDLF